MPKIMSRYTPLLLSLACGSAQVTGGPPAPNAGAASAAPNPAPTAPARLFSYPGGLMPRGVTSFGAAATDRHLYTLGGYFGVAHQYSREGQSDAFERMDFASGTWAQLPSPGAVQSATLTAFDGKLYRTGGLVIHNAAGEPEQLESVATVQRFDPRHSGAMRRTRSSPPRWS
jgi:hypothetical protein